LDDASALRRRSRNRCYPPPQLTARFALHDEAALAFAETVLLYPDDQGSRRRKMRKKSGPANPGATCGRPFAWRRKWALTVEDVVIVLINAKRLNRLDW
jgi:hypothetical protein